MKNNLKIKIEGVEILGDLLKTKVSSCWSNDCANNNVLYSIEMNGNYGQKLGHIGSIRSVYNTEDIDPGFTRFWVGNP